MARLSFILSIVIGLFAVLPTNAQDASPNPDCERIEAFMSLAAETGRRPDQIITGGGSISDSSPVQAVITADDAGDRWVFGALNTQVSGMSQITLETDVPLHVRVFKGFSPVELLQDNARVPEANITPGTQTVSVLLTGDGYYTVVVRRQNLADTTQTGSYTLTIGANVTGGVSPAPVDWRGQQAQAAQRDLLPENGIVSFPPEPTGEVTLRVFADSLRSIQVERSIVLELASAQASARGTLSWVREDVAEVALLDGNLSVYLNNGGFVYIENYAGTGRDSFTDEFNNFALQNDGRTVRGINWGSVQSLWVLPGCMGYELVDGGRRLIAEGRTLTITERPAASGGLGQNLVISGGSSEYNLTLDWQDMNRVRASAGLIDIDLSEDRSLHFDRLNLTFSQPPDAPFTVSEPGNVTLVSTDWANTRRIEIVRDVLRVTVDDLRDVVERSGRLLRTLETRAGTMRALWQDNSQTLMLPEAEDFIEIDTPAALPDYESGLRPRQVNEATGVAGYLPANMNNAGQECYPVNTVFDFNCAPNGEVNPANGGLSLSITDLFARGARLDLILSRTYNSHNALMNGPFGWGWNTDYLLDYAVDYAAGQQARRVTPGMEYPVGLDVTYAPLGLVIYTTASGSRHVFERGDEGWRSGTMPGWLIALRADTLMDDWHLARDDGTIYDFGRAGRLKAIRHVYGGELTITRTEFTLTDPDAGSSYEITDGTGRRLRLEYDGNQHIIRSELYDGETLLDSADYEYNAAGFLVAVRYGDGGQAFYEYTESGLLRHHDDPRAPLAQSLYYSYDDQGRVLVADVSAAPEQCGGTPRPFRCYRYTLDGDEFTTTVADQWGRENAWTLSVTDDPDTAFRLLRHTGPDGAQTNYSYGSGELARFPINFSRAGLQYALRWEPFGRPTVFQADGWINFSATYNTDVTLDIDGDGTPEFMLPLLESYRTDGENGPTDPVSYSYDPSSGLPVSVTESSGLVRRIDAREDRFGLPTQTTQIAGEITLPLAMAYDNYGFLASRQDSGGTDQYTWDALGRPIRYARLDSAANALVTYEVVYTITGDGRCMTITDPLGTQTTACYDRRARLVDQTVIDISGEVLEQTAYVYDDFDRLTRVTSQSGSGDPVITRYAYSSEGLAAGHWQLIETAPDGTQTITEYDEADRVVRVQDALGQVTTYDYPAPASASETVIQRAPGGVETTFEYNRARQLIRLDYGPVEWSLLYGGSRASIQREPSQIILNSGQGASTTIDFTSYDSAGRLTQANFVIRRPDDTNIEREPVRNDNTRADMTLRYTYDVFGRLLTIENPVTAEVTRFSYDVPQAGGRSVTVDDGQPVTYTYDALDRLISVESAERRVDYVYSYNTDSGLLEAAVTFAGADGTTRDWLLAYDSLGNLREWRSEEGRIALYEYDQRGRLVYVAYLDAEGEEIPVAEYTYNTSDQVTNIVNADGQEARYVYNDRGQLTTRRNFDGVVTTYLYDPRGNLQAVTDGLGYTTRYRYDDRDQLIAITDPIGREMNFERVLGNIGELRVQSNLLDETCYVFDLFNRLWQIQDSQGGKHFLRYDFDGRVSEWRAANGALTLGFSYGVGDELTAITGPDSWQWRYAYDSLGQLIERVEPDGASLQLDFDPLGYLEGLQTPGGEFARAYERTEPGILEVTEGNQSVRYAYDLFGRRIQETHGSATFQYDYREDGYSLTDPDGILTDTSYTGVLGDVEVPFIIVEQYGPDGTLFGERNYRVNQRGELVAIEQRAYFSGSETPYRVLERIDYDAEGRPIRYIDPENNLFAYSYDLAGRLNTTQYPDGGIYSYEYDTLNNLTGLVNPTGQRLQLSYNPLGYLIGVALNFTALENYTYTPTGWLLTRSFADYPDGSGQIVYTYSAAGVPTGWTAGGTVVNLEHSADALHRLNSVTNGGLTVYTYDSVGRLIGAGEQTFVYDNLNRPVTANLGGSQFITYTSYAGAGALAVDLPGGQTMRILLDSYQHIQRVEVNGQAVDVTYELLDGDMLEAGMTWGGHYSTQVRFNRLGHILLLQYRDDSAQQRLQRFGYTSNYAGLPLSIDDRENEIFIGYDNVFRPLTTNWLVTAGLKPRDSVDYAVTLAYDTQGNRVREVRQSIDGSLEEVIYRYEGGLLRAQNVADSGPASALSGVVLSASIMALALRRRRYLLPALLIGVFISGLLVVQAQPAPDYEYRYNDAGHLASITDFTDAAGPVTTTFSYDGFGRLISITAGEATTTFEYDAFGRLAAKQTPDGEIIYRYNGNQLIGLNDGTERTIVGLLDNHYLLLSGSENARWTLYDALGAIRQSFVGEVTDASNVENRFDILGRVLGDSPAEGTPLALPLFEGMLYDEAHNLYISLDGRAYDPATGRYLQRSLIGPDAAGNLYGFTPLPAAPPVQIRREAVYTEPLTLLQANARLLDAPTASSVRAAYLPPVYPGWQDAGLQALTSFHAAQATRFTDVARHTHTLIYNYNRAGVLPDVSGGLRLFDTANPAAPDHAPLLSALAAPQPHLLPDVTLRWLPQTVQVDIQPAGWIDADQWRGRIVGSAQVHIPEPIRGEREPSAVLDLLPLPLADLTAYADLFRALDDLPVEDAPGWIAEIEADVLPSVPEPLPDTLADWLDNWFTEDTLPVWTQLRALHQLPAAPGWDLPAVP